METLISLTKQATKQATKQTTKQPQCQNSSTQRRSECHKWLLHADGIQIVPAVAWDVRNWQLRKLIFNCEKSRCVISLVRSWQFLIPYPLHTLSVLLYRKKKPSTLSSCILIAEFRRLKRSTLKQTKVSQWLRVTNIRDNFLKHHHKITAYDCTVLSKGSLAERPFVFFLLHYIVLSLLALCLKSYVHLTFFALIYFLIYRQFFVCLFFLSLLPVNFSSFRWWGRGEVEWWCNSPVRAVWWTHGLGIDTGQTARATWLLALIDENKR